MNDIHYKKVTKIKFKHYKLTKQTIVIREMCSSF